jgi:hypothetical protein
MRRTRRMIFGVLASASLLGGAGGAALAAATVTPTGVVVAMVSHPTAVEY